MSKTEFDAAVAAIDGGQTYTAYNEQLLQDERFWARLP